MTNRSSPTARYADILNDSPELETVVHALDRDLTVAYTADAPLSVETAIGRLVAEQRPSRRRLLPPTPFPSRLVLACALVATIVLAAAVYLVVPVAERAFYTDAGSENVLTNGLATQLGLSQTQDGYTVTLQKAYADLNRVVVDYTIQRPGGEPFNDFARLARGRFQSTLTDASGAVLPPMAGAYVQGGAVLNNFDDSATRGTLATISLRLSIPLLEALGQSGASPFVFRFDVPVQPGRIVNPNLAVIAGGRTLILQRVVVTPSETRIYLAGLNGTGLFPHLTVDGYDSNHVSIHGWSPTEGGGSIWSIRPIGGGRVVCDFFQSLMAEHGTWTLTITAGPATADGKRVTGGPWVFRFSVP